MYATNQSNQNITYKHATREDKRCTYNLIKTIMHSLQLNRKVKNTKRARIKNHNARMQIEFHVTRECAMKSY